MLYTAAYDGGSKAKGAPGSDVYLGNINTHQHNGDV